MQKHILQTNLNRIIVTEMEKPAVIIAARMGSTRLPGKSLSEIQGTPMIEQLVRRVRHSDIVGPIILATTVSREDDVLVRWATNLGLGCYRGSVFDVLGRLASAVEHFELNYFIEILGDNPLVHHSLIDASWALFKSLSVDYVATLTNEYPGVPSSFRRFPIGVRVQIMRREAILKCNELAVDESHREHATTFIAENPEIFPRAFVEAKNEFEYLNRPDLNFAVNTERNLLLVKKIFRDLGGKQINFSLDQVVNYLSKNRDLLALMGN